MPTRPKTDCAEPGCSTPVDRGRCPEHKREHRELTSPKLDYGPHWPRIRARQLRAHPTCARCGAPATDVDHITPLRFFTTLRAAHDPRNLQSLCGPCHRRKTVLEDSDFAARARRRRPRPTPLRSTAVVESRGAKPPPPTLGGARDQDDA